MISLDLVNDPVGPYVLVGQAVSESTGIYSLVIALLLLFVVG